MKIEKLQILVINPVIYQLILRIVKVSNNDYVIDNGVDALTYPLFSTSKMVISLSLIFFATTFEFSISF